jgi:uncharacterized membrane protein
MRPTAVVMTVLAAVMIPVTIGIVRAAYEFNQVRVEMEVFENIELLTPEFEVELFPGESAVVEALLRNIGTEASTVLIDVTVSPEGAVEAEAQPYILVPADGQVHGFEIDLEAHFDAQPGIYVVTVALSRAGVED